MRATEILPARFKPMPDDPAAAMRTLRRQRMNRAFEAIEVMRNSIDHDLKWLVVIIAATLASRAPMPIPIRRRLFLPILSPLRSRLTLNHPPNVNSQRPSPIGKTPQRNVSLPPATKPSRSAHFAPPLAPAD